MEISKNLGKISLTTALVFVLILPTGTGLGPLDDPEFLEAPVLEFSDVEVDWTRIKIGFDGPIPEDAQERGAQRGGTLVLESEILGFVVYTLDAETDPQGFIDRFTADGDVQWAVPDAIVGLQSGPRNPLSPNPPNDPLFLAQYGPQLIQAPAAWNHEAGRPSIVVAVLDTGVDITHPDLLANCIPDCALSGYDVFGHGTHVAGIIAAHTNNGQGIAGVAPEVSLMSVKALSDAGTSWWSQLAVAIVAATLAGADIINMSLGGNCNAGIVFVCPEVALAVQFAWNQGVLLVASSGNSGSTTQIGHPAAFPEVIAVGAVDSTATRAWFSQAGPGLELMAPGVDVVSTVPPASALALLCASPSFPTLYASCSGTSMAAPHVAGVAGLIWSHCPSLSNVAVRTILTSTALSLGTPALTGNGLVQADQAVAVTPVC